MFLRKIKEFVKNIYIGLKRFKYVNVTNGVEAHTTIHCDSNSYSCRIVKDGKLEAILTARNNFGHQYNKYYDRKEKCYCTTYVAPNKVTINHKRISLNLDITEDFCNVQIIEKEP